MLVVPLLCCALLSQLDDPVESLDSEPETGTIASLAAHVDNEYLRALEPDPDETSHRPNHAAREVSSGHFVPVWPTKLASPYIVACSADVVRLLGLHEIECRSEAFVRVFSGDLEDAPPGFDSPWATPYALSIYGQVTQPDGAGPRGYGYGDGRAISIAEVRLETDGRYELQLKGAGRTPFCRGADGRAVLRSSAREFIASEAMAALGVPTTRALSLVASASERVRRPWYRNASTAIALGTHVPLRHGGDVTREERAAITTRAASSFLRVGQFELYGRRASRGDKDGRRQLEQLARHALRREYPAQRADDAADAAADASPLAPQVVAMVAEAARRFARLAAEWLRVGYTQSNFNSDNCHMGGLTIDYGPFGWIERYDPGWGMWIHSEKHYSFANQPSAAGKNLEMLALSLVPLLDGDRDLEAQLYGVVRGYATLAEQAVDAMWATKLGFSEPSEQTRTTRAALERLLRSVPTDYTILWRQLSWVPESWADGTAAGSDAAAADENEMFVGMLRPAWYEPPTAEQEGAWAAWAREWLLLLARAEGGVRDGDPRAANLTAVSERMRRANPKYVPREWMLAEAYGAAERGEHRPLLEMADLFRTPYDEHPKFEARYYRKAPSGAEQQGGIGFMS